ncbi:helix-turn-helix domain-containing protein [Reichenbachiella sp.]
MEFRQSFGEFIREKREKSKLPLRKIAAELDIDPSTLSKIEKGNRSAKLEMIPTLSDVLSVSQDDLLIMFLVDSVSADLLGIENFEEILDLSKERIKYIRSIRAEQGRLDI